MQPVGLCGVPFRVLQEQAAQVLVAAQADQGAASSPLEGQQEDQQTQLWVDKYKPR